MKLVDHADTIVDVGEKAGKEFQIESSMAKMKKDWEGEEFKLKPFKNTGTFTIVGFDDAMLLLDEQIVLT
jgi:dynein heavy chain